LCPKQWFHYLQTPATSETGAGTTGGQSYHTLSTLNFSPVDPVFLDIRMAADAAGTVLSEK
jgi:hypothetical protein